MMCLRLSQPFPHQRPFWATQNDQSHADTGGPTSRIGSGSVPRLPRRIPHSLV